MGEEKSENHLMDFQSGGATSTITEEMLESNFEEKSVFLTRRQAMVLSMRERGADQGQIADRMECSRANVSNIERSARDNIEKARATLSFAEILTAPVRVELPKGQALHKIPDRIYEASDTVGVKVNYGAPELMRRITAVSQESEQHGRLIEDLVVTITSEGEAHVISSSDK